MTASIQVVATGTEIDTGGGAVTAPPSVAPLIR